MKTRICPFCAEEIKAAAVVCRYCQRDIPPVVAPDAVKSTTTVAPVVLPPMETQDRHPAMSVSTALSQTAQGSEVASTTGKTSASGPGRIVKFLLLMAVIVPLTQMALRSLSMGPNVRSERALFVLAFTGLLYASPLLLLAGSFALARKLARSHATVPDQTATLEHPTRKLRRNEALAVIAAFLALFGVWIGFITLANSLKNVAETSTVFYAIAGVLLIVLAATVAYARANRRTRAS